MQFSLLRRFLDDHFPTLAFETSWSLGLPLAIRSCVAPTGSRPWCGPSPGQDHGFQGIATNYKHDMVDFCSCRPPLVIESTAKPRFFMIEMPMKFCPMMLMIRPFLKCALSFDRLMIRHCRRIRLGCGPLVSCSLLCVF